MFSVFNANLQTDMGKTIVRRHLDTTDAQSVWRELSEHMRTSSKGASEKRRLTQYVTNTVLDDNFTGTTEQFVLHFNEQFRQLDEFVDANQQSMDQFCHNGFLAKDSKEHLALLTSHIVLNHICSFDISHKLE